MTVFSDRWNDWRALAALVAASVGTLICVHQQHFVLTADVRSFETMLTHRCGVVFTVGVGWAAVEFGVACWRGLGLRQLIQSGEELGQVDTFSPES